MRLAAFLASLAFLSTSVFAESAFDFSARGLLRSFPTGASLTATLGHGTKFWGGGNKTLYGFVRPSVSVQTSGVVNYGKAQFDLYPVSFLGGYAGYSIGTRSLDELDTFDCTRVICDETLKRPYFGFRLALAYAGVFLTTDNKVEEIEVDGRAGLFAEESSSLIGRSGSDVLTSNLFIAGYELNSAWSVGGFYLRNSMKHNRNDSSMALGFARLKRNNWNFMVGAGNFHSRDNRDHFTVLGIIDWVGSKGLLLF